MKRLSWFDLEERFHRLHGKDTVGLRANWKSTPWNKQGEHWSLSGARDARQIKQFKWIVEHAALKLKHLDQLSAVPYWLDLLRRDSPNFRADGILATWARDGRIKRSHTGKVDQVCEASADYCLNLATEEARESLADPEAPQRGSSALRQARRTKRVKTKAQLKRERVIFGAIQTQLKALNYCRELDSKKLKVPQAWKEQGCPNGYESAYKLNNSWKKKIWDEKHRNQQKYDALSNAARERIIQGTRDTRATRS